MSNSPHTHYTIRSYQRADFNKYVRLNIEAEKLEPSGRCVSPQAIAEHLGRPNCSPEQDLFVVEVAGKICGYMDVVTELTIGRVILDCWVHPECRREGLATKLLGCAARRAKELGAKVVHVNVSRDNAVAKVVLSELGFRFIRRFLQMRLDISKVRWQDVNPAVLQCRHLQHGEEDKLTQIQNRSFAGTWGYKPNTEEEIIYRIGLTNCSPEDVVLACDGDKVIGYCWTKIIHEMDKDERKGRVFMLGVAPDYRGKGIGKGVLLAGLSNLKSRGLQVVELAVDSKNKAACSLYRSVNFKVRTSSLWYEKEIV